MKGFVDCTKRLWRHSLRVLLFPSKEWQQILEEKASIKSVTLGYLLPWILLCAIVRFFCTLVWEKMPMDVSMVFGTLFSTIIFYGISYYFSVVVGGVLLFGNIKSKNNMEMLSVMIAYSMTIYFLVDLLLNFLPEMDYLIVLDLYVVYLLYTGCKILPININGSLNRTVAILSAVMIFLPVLLHLVLNLLLPNM